MPAVAFINQAKTSLGVDLAVLVAVLQKFVDTVYFPVWRIPATLQEAPDFIPGAWAMVFVDDPDQQGDQGVHDVTPDGQPMSRIFVKTIVERGDKVSVVACHELAEMLVDPTMNHWVTGPNGTLYAYETADAVDNVGFLIDGITMSDFVYPAYFDISRAPGSAQFDYCKRVSQPFQILTNGFAVICEGGVVKYLFGSGEKAESFLAEDRRGHRSQYRLPYRELLRSRPSSRRNP